jgi:hypothetical protein
VYSQFHEQLAKADPQRDRPPEQARHVPRGQPPPGRLRGGAAHALACAARRLDRERARRVLA